MTTDFHWTDLPEPHRERARAIIACHPQIASLIGRNQATFGLILLTTAAQFLLAWLLRDGPWWLILAAGVTIGAVIANALWVMIHECAHRRVFRGWLANRMAGMVANLSMVVPSSTSFEKYHLRHHIHQGVYVLDSDLPSQWEVRMFGGTALGRAAWLAGFALMVGLRPARIASVPLWDRWLVLNCVLVFSCALAVLWFWGPWALAYLLLSLCMGIGLHPLGARWIQEHYTASPDQETFSYYGPLRFVQMNVGCHNEHHDFPGIPWNRLHLVRRIAPEYYDGLRSHKSLSRLLFDFVWRGSPGIQDRITRDSVRPAVPPKGGDALELI